jgi:hypothetical protein
MDIYYCSIARGWNSRSGGRQVYQDVVGSSILRESRLVKSCATPDGIVNLLGQSGLHPCDISTNWITHGTFWRTRQYDQTRFVLFSGRASRFTIRHRMYQLNHMSLLRRYSQVTTPIFRFTLVQGETNSFSLHGTPGVSDSAEAAIWLADYVLQAATLNVQQLDFHGGVGFA